MKISLQEVEHVARLARLKLTDEQSATLVDQLSDVLTYFDKLNELNTADVEPMSHAVQLSDVFRRDSAENSIERDEALANAPAQQDGFFKVPKVLG